MKAICCKVLAPLTFFLWAAQTEVKANPITPTWDLVGSYGLFYYVQLGYYTMSLDITSMNFAGGGTGTFNATSSESFSYGSFDGSAITFATVDGLHVFDGTIAPDGTMSGGMVAYGSHGAWYGFWGTLSGRASEMPEPSSMLLLGVGLLGLGVFASLKRRACQTLSKSWA